MTSVLLPKSSTVLWLSRGVYLGKWHGNLHLSGVWNARKPVVSCKKNSTYTAIGKEIVFYGPIFWSFFPQAITQRVQTLHTINYGTMPQCIMFTGVLGMSRVDRVVSIESVDQFISILAAGRGLKLEALALIQKLWVLKRLNSFQGYPLFERSHWIQQIPSQFQLKFTLFFFFFLFTLVSYFLKATQADATRIKNRKIKDWCLLFTVVEVWFEIFHVYQMLYFMRFCLVSYCDVES